MTTRRWFATSSFYGVLLAIAWLCPRPAHAAPVTEKEAIETAEFWYPAEVNFYEQKGWKRRGVESKAELLSAARVARLRYLVGKDAIVDKLKGDQDVLAYIVEFEPTGHVVISADDRFPPLLAFEIDSDFVWEDSNIDPGHNFMKNFLNNYVDSALEFFYKEAQQQKMDEPNTYWSNLRVTVGSQKDLPAEDKSFIQQGSAMATVTGTPDPQQEPVLLDTAAWDQHKFYNEEIAHHVDWIGGNEPPDYPDRIATGCAATAFAIVLRYHEWPYVGTGVLEHNDVWGHVQGGGEIDWTVDPGAKRYLWDQMPTTNITSSYPEIAKLMYHMGLVIAADWELEGTSGQNNAPTNTNNIKNYFRYKDAQFVEAYRATPAPEANCQHEQFAGYDYFFCPTPRMWYSAAQYCSYANAYLVDIRNEDENNFIIDKKGSEENAWIGATDAFSEGDWWWQRTGEVFWLGGVGGHPAQYPSGEDYYNNWPGWEPDDEPYPANCAYSAGFSGFWISYSCALEMPYICKRRIDSSLILPQIIESVVGGLPVLTGIVEINGGHNVVIDGYDPNRALGKYYRVNMGWGGSSNDWYTLYDNMPKGMNILECATVHMTPENYIYVDKNYSGTETGSLATPYNTISEGVLQIPVADWLENPKGGHLWIKAGAYSGTGDFPITIQWPMEISSYSGDVSIGGKLFLKHSGIIRLPMQNGTLTIH